MRNLLIALLFITVIVACSSPKDTLLPRELDKMETIKPAIEKLTPDERELASRYVVRHTVGAKLGGLFGGIEGPGIPEGMTLGGAIEEQRKFEADVAIERDKQKALKAKLEAEREAVIKPMREAVTITLISKEIETERGYSGIVMDEKLNVTFGYRNNTNKDVAGVKGYISVRDLFGDEISGFLISNDETIQAGHTVTWSGSRSVRFSFGTNKDRKLAELGDDKYNLVWEPRMIVFTDGTKLSIPDK